MYKYYKKKGRKGLCFSRRSWDVVPIGGLLTWCALGMTSALHKLSVKLGSTHLQSQLSGGVGRREYFQGDISSTVSVFCPALSQSSDGRVSSYSITAKVVVAAPFIESTIPATDEWSRG